MPWLFLARIGQAQSALQGLGARARDARGWFKRPPLYAGQASIVSIEDGTRRRNILMGRSLAGPPRLPGAPPAFRSRQQARASAACFGGFARRLSPATPAPGPRSWDVAFDGRYPARHVPVQRAPRRAVMMPPGGNPGPAGSGGHDPARRHRTSPVL